MQKFFIIVNEENIITEQQRTHKKPTKDHIEISECANVGRQKYVDGKLINMTPEEIEKFRAGE